MEEYRTIRVPRQYFCEVEGCPCNYPCSIHPKPKFKLEISNKDVQPRKMRFDKITWVDVMYLPCGHSFALPENIKAGDRKKFQLSCEDCNAQYHVEMVPDVIEFTRID